MAEADYSGISAYVPNELMKKVIKYGLEHEIMQNVSTFEGGMKKVELRVNISETVRTILEKFFAEEKA